MKSLLICAVFAHAAFHTQLPASTSGLRKKPFRPHSGLKSVGEVTSGAQLLWNISADDVGKITSLALNAQADVLITGSTYTPLNQVSAVTLSTGKLASKGSPEDQFSYVTAVTADASHTVVYGCAVSQDKDCTLGVFKGTDVSVTPTWHQTVKGYNFWGKQALKMSGDGSVLAVTSLTQLPQVQQPVPGTLLWYNVAGSLSGKYAMNASMGDVWASEKYIAVLEFTTQAGFLRILGSRSPSSNCTIPVDYGIGVSSSISTVFQPYRDSSENVFVKQQKGAQQCADNWQYQVQDELVAIGTSDVASIYGSQNGLRLTFSVFQNSLNANPPKPSTFTLTLPTGYPVVYGEDIHIAFSSDGAHAALAVAGLGLYYIDLKAPSAPVQVFAEDNVCGVLALAIDTNTKGEIFIAASTNQLVSVSPDALECMEGGEGVAAFKISK